MKSELALIKQRHPELGHKAAFEKACRSWQELKHDVAQPQQATAEEKGGKKEMEVAADAVLSRQVQPCLATPRRIPNFTTVHAVRLCKSLDAGPPKSSSPLLPFAPLLSAQDPDALRVLLSFHNFHNITSFLLEYF